MAKEDKAQEPQPSEKLDMKVAADMVKQAFKHTSSATKRRSSVISPEGLRLNTEDKVSIRRHDFTNPSVISDREVERLRRLHQDMISAFEAEASLFLRSEVSMVFSDLKVLDYHRSLREVEESTHLALFRADPLPGIGFLEISPTLALSAVNQVLGGKGDAPKELRHLTRIETDLIEEFLLLLLQVWCNQWQYETDPVPSVVEHEISPSALQICEPNTAMLMFALDVSLGSSKGRIQLVVPLFMVDSMIRHLQGQSLSAVESTTTVRKPFWQDGYNEVPIPAEVLIDVGSMRVNQFNSLRVGDTIPLADDCMDNATLRLAGKPLFSGQYGVDNGKMGLCIKSKLQS